MMRGRNYFKEMGIEIGDLQKNLDVISDKLFTFSCLDEQDEALRRRQTRKVKYRIVSQQKRVQPTAGC